MFGRNLIFGVGGGKGRERGLIFPVFGRFFPFMEDLPVVIWVGLGSHSTHK
jgi:hypothetical protein